MVEPIKLYKKVIIILHAAIVVSAYMYISLSGLPFTVHWEKDNFRGKKNSKFMLKMVYNITLVVTGYFFAKKFKNLC